MLLKDNRHRYDYEKNDDTSRLHRPYRWQCDRFHWRRTNDRGNCPRESVVGCGHSPRHRKSGFDFADDFIGIDGRGFVTDKATELKEAEPPAADSSAPQLLKEDLSDFTARIYGNIAVLNLTNTAHFSSKGKETTIKHRRQRFGCATRATGGASRFTGAAFSIRQRTDILLCRLISSSPPVRSRRRGDTDSSRGEFTPIRSLEVHVGTSQTFS
jgi:hypothetical protein